MDLTECKYCHFLYIIWRLLETVWLDCSFCHRPWCCCLIFIIHPPFYRRGGVHLYWAYFYSCKTLIFIHKLAFVRNLVFHKFKIVSKAQNIYDMYVHMWGCNALHQMNPHYRSSWKTFLQLFEIPIFGWLRFNWIFFYYRWRHWQGKSLLSW